MSACAQRALHRLCPDCRSEAAVLKVAHRPHEHETDLEAMHAEAERQAAHHRAKATPRRRRSGSRSSPRKKSGKGKKKSGKKSSSPHRRLAKEWQAKADSIQATLAGSLVRDDEAAPKRRRRPSARDVGRAIARNPGKAVGSALAVAGTAAAIANRKKLADIDAHTVKLTMDRIMSGTVLRPKVMGKKTAEYLMMPSTKMGAMMHKPKPEPAGAS